nr:hypothetical protein [Spirochaetales bacterium]
LTLPLPRFNPPKPDSLLALSPIEEEVVRAGLQVLVGTLSVCCQLPSANYFTIVTTLVRGNDGGFLLAMMTLLYYYVIHITTLRLGS